MKNLNFANYKRALITENKWRASRYGIDGKLIDFGKEIEVSARDLIIELLEFVDDVVDELDSRSDIEYVYKILANGTGADRQLAVFNKSQDMDELVDYITTQTLVGTNI